MKYVKLFENYDNSKLIIEIYNEFNDRSELYELSNTFMNQTDIEKSVKRAYNEAKKYPKFNETFNGILNEKYGIRPISPFMKINLEME